MRGENELNHAVVRCIDDPLSHADGCGPQEKRELVLADRGSWYEDCLGHSPSGKSLTRAVTLPILALGGASLFMAAQFESAPRSVAGLTPIVARVSGGIETSRDRLLSWLTEIDVRYPGLRAPVLVEQCHARATCLSIIPTSCCRGMGACWEAQPPPTDISRPSLSTAARGKAQTGSLHLPPTLR